MKNTKMKIGILTVYFADYGSFFHTYSLYHYLIKEGYDCEIIHACGRLKYSPRFRFAVTGAKYLPNFILNRIKNKVSVFRSYMNLIEDVNKFNISEKYNDIGKLSEKYDCILVGSDELWSATNPTIRFVPEYFGIGVKCPIISYSTSGVTFDSPSREMLEKIKQGLQHFSSIAVRDTVTAEWVGNLIGKEVPVVLDPTLLYPCFVGKKLDLEHYIIVYGEHFTQEAITLIREFSRQKNLPLKSVVWKHSWCDDYLETSSASDLQNYFRSSTFSVTSTFHGTIFSIVNKINFMSFVTPERGKKVQLLLKQLHLQDRLNQGNPITDTPVDYTLLETLLADKRKDSEKYLKEAFNKIRGTKEHDL